MWYLYGVPRECPHRDVGALTRTHPGTVCYGTGMRATVRVGIIVIQKTDATSARDDACRGIFFLAAVAMLFDDEWNAPPDSSSSDDDATDPTVSLAKRLGGGRAAARAAHAGGAVVTSADLMPTVSRMLDAGVPATDRLSCIRAIAELAQVVANATPLREAGAVDACVQLLDDAHFSNAAAEAIRHLACASNPNRTAAREAGAIPKLVAMLTRVANVVEAAMSSADEAAERDGEAIAAVTAATAALRNLSYQNGPNRDLISFEGGLLPLIRIVAHGTPPRPPPSTSYWREASYRAAGALENLSSDHIENANAIVESGVVPAMAELLIGLGTGSDAADERKKCLSQKAARTGRAALFKMISMERARHAQRREEEKVEAVKAAGAKAARGAEASAAVLMELTMKTRSSSSAAATGAAGAAAEAEDAVTVHGGDGSIKQRLARRASMAMALSELVHLASGCEDSLQWATEVMRFVEEVKRSQQQQQQQRCCGDSCDGGGAATVVDEAAVIIRPPIALAAGHLDKASRTAIHLMFQRPPLGEYCASRSDSEGRIVVERQRCPMHVIFQ